MRKPSLAVVFSLSCSALAFATPASAQNAGAPPPPPPPHHTDGVRFRGAIALAGGGEFGSGGGVSYGGGLGGLEGRLGVQINNLIGIYVQPSLAFGPLTETQGASSVTGATGTAGATALVDFTFVNRFFVAAGGGAGILNNPFGPEIHFRLGGYPLVGYGENGYTRKGLMVGVDTHVFFLSSPGAPSTMVQIMGTVGYEVF